MIRYWRLPKTISLPGGFKIKVAVAKLVKLGGSWDYDMEDGGGVITIQEGLSAKQQQFYLAHEITHVAPDYMLWVLMNGSKP